SGDRGLAGAYNSSVIRAAERSIQGHQRDGHDYVLVTAGRKAEGYYRYRGYRVDDAFSGFSEQPSYEDARQDADAVRDRYIERELEQVELAYTRFLSVGSQRVTVSRLLPLDPGQLNEAREDGPQADYEFE